MARSNEIRDSEIIVIFAHLRMADTSVGPKAVAVLKDSARYLLHVGDQRIRDLVSVVTREGPLATRAPNDESVHTHQSQRFTPTVHPRACSGAVVWAGRLPRSTPLIPVWYHARMAMTLRLTDEDEQALALLADAQGISKQEATVRAIRDAAARRVHEDRVRDLSAAARARYADVLERLGR